jgi:hypothetical protein
MNTPLQAQPVLEPEGRKVTETQQRTQENKDHGGPYHAGRTRRAASAPACRCTPDRVGKRSTQRR